MAKNKSADVTAQDSQPAEAAAAPQERPVDPEVLAKLRDEFRAELVVELCDLAKRYPSANLAKLVGDLKSRLDRMPGGIGTSARQIGFNIRTTPDTIGLMNDLVRCWDSLLATFNE